MMEMFSVFLLNETLSKIMLCVMNIPANAIFRAARAFFVFEHFPLYTWSVVEFLNNNNGNQRI